MLCLVMTSYFHRLTKSGAAHTSARRTRAEFLLLVLRLEGPNDADMDSVENNLDRVSFSDAFMCYRTLMLLCVA